MQNSPATWREQRTSGKIRTFASERRCIHETEVNPENGTLKFIGHILATVVSEATENSHRLSLPSGEQLLFHLAFKSTPWQKKFHSNKKGKRETHHSRIHEYTWQKWAWDVHGRAPEKSDVMAVPCGGEAVLLLRSREGRAALTSELIGCLGYVKPTAGWPDTKLRCGSRPMNFCLV